MGLILCTPLCGLTLTGGRHKPEYKIECESGKVVQYKGDAAFVLHLIGESKGKLLFTVMKNLLEDPRRTGRA